MAEYLAERLAERRVKNIKYQKMMSEYIGMDIFNSGDVDEYSGGIIDRWFNEWSR